MHGNPSNNKSAESSPPPDRRRDNDGDVEKAGDGVGDIAPAASAVTAAGTTICSSPADRLNDDTAAAAAVDGNEGDENRMPDPNAYASSSSSSNSLR